MDTMPILIILEDDFLSYLTLHLSVVEVFHTVQVVMELCSVDHCNTCVQTSHLTKLQTLKYIKRNNGAYNR